MITKVQYVEFLVSTVANFTGTYLAEHLDDVSHDTVTDFLQNKRLTARHLWEVYGGGATDAFVSKIKPDGNGVGDLTYSTYLGGNGDDVAYSVAIDNTGASYVTGGTYSFFNTTFAGTPGALLAGVRTNGIFVTKFAPDGSSRAYSAFLGGTNTDYGSSIAVDASGVAYITGITRNPSLEFIPLAGYHLSFYGGNGDAFVAKLSADGRLPLYFTYMGGRLTESGADIAIDSNGTAYITGQTNSGNFPSKNALQPLYNGSGGDAFVVKLTTGNAVAPTATPTFTPTPTRTPTATPLAPPPFTYSRYIGPAAFRNDTFKNDGGVEARDEITRQIRDAFVILHFGDPYITVPAGTRTVVYGTSLPASNYAAQISDIEQALQKFIEGYVEKKGVVPIHLTLGVGLSNKIHDNSAGLVPDGYKAHANEWAKMLFRLRAFANQKDPTGSVTIVGAVDIEAFQDDVGNELSLASAVNTRRWVDSYSETTSIPYFNFGACIGCPVQGPLPAGRGQIVGSRWSLEDYWYVSWRVTNAFPFPQIYLSNTHELQWANVKKWAETCTNCEPALRGGLWRAIRFSGALTQFKACEQKREKGVIEPSCRSPNTPQQGWTLLVSAVNQPLLQWSSDMKWDQP